MTRLRQIAVAAVGCGALMVGMAGCMASRPETVSANAVMETSGNKTLTWTASSHGRATVWDQNADKVVYGATVREGQTISVDVDRNQIMLDNQIVNQNALHGGDQYKIYFEPTSNVETQSRTETDTVETSHDNH